MPSTSRLLLPVALLATVLALTACTPPSGSGSTTDDGTTTDGGGDATHDDPFAPDPPTTPDGWTQRYTDLPWLSDDLDNDDFFITGTVDGHDVMGIYCNDNGDGPGSGSASLLSTGDSSTDLELQTPTEFDVTVARSQFLTFTGTGTYSLPSEPQGTHPLTLSLGDAFEYDASPGKDSATPSTASIALEALGMPFPDPETCQREKDELFSWASSAGGH